MPKLNKLYLGLVLTISCFLLIGYWVVKPDLEQYRKYLSFSPALDGTKAWRELLEQDQAEVQEWRQSWRNLPPQDNQLLVAIEPYGIIEAEHQELRSWVEQGNDLILFQYQLSGWEEFSMVSVEDGQGEKPVWSGEQKGAAAEGLSARIATSFRLAPSAEQTVLLSDANGILGSRIAVGAGSVSIVLAPDWLTNDAILEHSHFELVWPLFDKAWDVVWIDEAHHGYQQKPGLLAVYPAWLVIACIQLGVALLFWLWLHGKRFGPVYTPRAWTVRRGDETLQAVAGWYERLGLREEALVHQQQLLRQLLYEHWGLSPSASITQAAQLARMRWPEAQVARLVRLLELSPPVEPGELAQPNAGTAHAPVRTKAFVQHTRELSELIALIEQDKPPASLG